MDADSMLIHAELYRRAVNSGIIFLSLWTAEASSCITLAQVFELELQAVAIHCMHRRHRKTKRFLVQPWLTPHQRMEYEQYNQLICVLSVEDEDAFTSYVQMPLQVFTELLHRIMLVILKQHTH